MAAPAIPVACEHYTASATAESLTGPGRNYYRFPCGCIAVLTSAEVATLRSPS